MSARSFLAAVLLSLLVGAVASFGGALMRDAIFDPPATAMIASEGT